MILVRASFLISTFSLEAYVVLATRVLEDHKHSAMPFNIKPQDAYSVQFSI